MKWECCCVVLYGYLLSTAKAISGN